MKLFTYEIQETYFHQYYYKIYRNKKRLLRSGLFKLKEEACREAAYLCEDMNMDPNIMSSL